MEEIDSSPASPNPRKRAAPDEDSPEKKPLNLKGTQFMMATPPDTDQSNNASPTGHDEQSGRQGSPAPSFILSSVDMISNSPMPATTQLSTAPTTSSSGPPPAKKRKLTPSEKEQQRRDKEAKAAERAAEKARKDAEKATKDAEKAELKAVKDEQKAVKDDEKRKKAEEREEKKREKDLAEERKNQEKLKKERAQMRLGAFFQGAPTPARDSPGGEGPSRTARRKSLSLEPFDAVADQIRRSESPCKSAAQPVTSTSTPLRPAISDYRKYFLPFQLQSNCSMASMAIVEDLDEAQAAFDLELNDESMQEKFDLGLLDSYASLSQQFTYEPRGLPVPSMRQLVDQIQGSLQQPIDLTHDEPAAHPLDALQTVPYKYLEFREDVRPAYCGTYTKIRSPRAVRQLSTNPFSRTRTDTEYDYDSEVEWEEPEEGEDILDEEEEETESLGDAHEMDEFLDDEADPMNKRKMITGDLVPTCTGICWESEAGKIIPSIEGSNPFEAMRGMRMGVLLPALAGQTIDPFSTAYWQSEAVQQPVQDPPAALLMPPPRQPLQPRPNGGNTLDFMLKNSTGEKIASSEGTTGPKAQRIPKGTVTTLSSEDLEEFKGFVVGSQLNKGDLLKELKARFPKLTMETIKSTLGEHFAQVGAKASEKRWGVVSVA